MLPGIGRGSSAGRCSGRAAHSDRLAGSAVLRQQIIDGLTEEQIRETWKEGLAAYNQIRKKYLLYP